MLYLNTVHRPQPQKIVKNQPNRKPNPKIKPQMQKEDSSKIEGINWNGEAQGLQGKYALCKVRKRVKMNLLFCMHPVCK